MESIKKNTYKGISIQSVVTVILGLLGILYFSIMSRLLTKEDFGFFAIITAITSILTSLTEAGLGAAVIQNKYADKDYIKTAFALSIFLGSILGIILFFTSDLISELMVGSKALRNGYRIMSFSLILYSVNSVCRAVVVKNLQFLKYGIFDILAFFISSSIGIIMAIKDMGFYSVIIAVFLHQLLLFVQLLYVNHSFFSFKLSGKYIKPIVSYSGWLTGSVIVRNIIQQIDKLITTHWIPVAVLGAYNRPSGLISQIVGNINGIYDTILFPILSGINDDLSKINIAYEKSVKLIFLLSLLLTCCFVLGSDVIISIFLGNKWLYLSPVFQIISISIIFLCYGRIADCFFRSLGVVKSYFFTRVCVMVLSCLCILAGCQYGIYGLAMGLTISRAVDTFTKVLFLRPYITINRIEMYKSLYRSACIPMFVFIFCYILKSFIPFGNIFGIFVYITIIMFVAILTPQKLGSVFFDDVYRVVKNRISLYLKKNSSFSH